MNDNEDRAKATPPDPVRETEWGRQSADHFGYASETERLAKRGLEDWELVDKIPESQRGVPVWFLAVVAVVLLVAIGLSFPFWGDRPGYEREWWDWGFVAALVYFVVGAGFIYIMVNLYGTHAAGRLDSDKEAQQTEGEPDGRDPGKDDA